MYSKIFISIISLILAASPAIASEHASQPALAKPALLLIHAFPTDSQLYQPQQNDLKKEFNVIAVDLKGFGKAEPVNGQAISMGEYADQIKKELDAQGIKKAIIGGESMGGYVALAFVQKYPASVSGLILSDTQTIADTDATKAKREATAQDVLANGTTKLINDFLPKALSANADKNVVIYLQDIMQAQKPNAIASALRGMAQREDTSSILAAVKIPVLIITGSQDVVIAPAQSKSMHELLPTSKLVTIVGAGHLSSLENPKAWNAAVRSVFLKGKSL